MKENKVVQQFVLWGSSIAIAWLMGTGIHHVFEFFIRYDIQDYFAKRALFGMIVLSVIWFFLSRSRDRQDKNGRVSLVDNIQSDSESRNLELSVFASRISLSGYVIYFWFQQSVYWDSKVAYQSVTRLGFFEFAIFWFLGLALISLISSYLLVLEPWKNFIISNTNPDNQGSILSMSRCGIFLVINLYQLIFSLPDLNVKPLAVILSVFFLLIIIGLQISCRNLNRRKPARKIG